MSKGELLDMLCNLAYVKNESRSTALSRLIDAVNRETCKVHNLLRPFGVSNYHLFVISSAKNRNISSFTVTTVFVDTRLWKTFQKFPSLLFWKRFRGCFVLQSGVLTKKVVNGLCAAYMACREMACRKMVETCCLCT